MYFRGEYSLYDDVWRNSLLCNFAGILAPLSSEASILFIVLITIDRVIVVKYPFGEYRIKEKRAYILCNNCMVHCNFNIYYTSYIYIIFW